MCLEITILQKSACMVSTTCQADMDFFHKQPLLRQQEYFLPSILVTRVFILYYTFYTLYSSREFLCIAFSRKPLKEKFRFFYLLIEALLFHNFLARPGKTSPEVVLFILKGSICWTFLYLCSFYRLPTCFTFG